MPPVPFVALRMSASNLPIVGSTVEVQGTAGEPCGAQLDRAANFSRSEERRGGKEGRCRCDGSADVCSSDLRMSASNLPIVGSTVEVQGTAGEPCGAQLDRAAKSSTFTCRTSVCPLLNVTLYRKAPDCANGLRILRVRTTEVGWRNSS